MRAEAELLCICARTHIVADDAMRARQLSGMVDWERLLKLALRHGVLPLLSQQLNASTSSWLLKLKIQMIVIGAAGIENSPAYRAGISAGKIL